MELTSISLRNFKTRKVTKICKMLLLKAMLRKVNNVPGSCINIPIQPLTDCRNDTFTSTNRTTGWPVSEL